VPVSSPVATSAITIVVVSQDSVPSASGASVGTEYTETTGLRSFIAHPCWSWGSTFVR
jgi:hypothetical protein